MTFKEFIRLVRRQKNIPVKEICKALDISLTTFHRLEDGRILYPHPHLLREYAKVLDADYMYLMELCGYVAAPELDKGQAGQRLPVFSWDGVPGLEKMSYDQLCQLSKQFIDYDGSQTSVFCMDVGEDFWLPEIQRGDRVIVEKDPKAISDKDILLLSVKKPLIVTFRRVRIFSGKKFLHAMTIMDQPQEQEWTDGQAPVVIGKVIEIRRTFQGGL